MKLAKATWLSGAAVLIGAALLASGVEARPHYAKPRLQKSQTAKTYQPPRRFTPPPSPAPQAAPRLVPAPVEAMRFEEPRPKKPKPKTFKSKARNVIILDPMLERPLFERKADQPISPASMTKLMTFLVALREIDEGAISFASRFKIGKWAASRPGSSMRLKQGERPTVEQLLFGAMVVSGNDAATALAQGVAGSQKAFVRRMNRTAEALGLKNSRFRNPTGFTAKGHHMSVRDLARLAEHLVVAYPEASAFFTRRSFKWGGVAQRNRNPLLFTDLSDIDVSVEGMKTGYTRAAGYCAVVSAVQKRKGAPPRRVIAVLAGLPSEAARAREAERAIRWAFSAGEVKAASIAPSPGLRPEPGRKL